MEKEPIKEPIGEKRIERRNPYSEAAKTTLYLQANERMFGRDVEFTKTDVENIVMTWDNLDEKRQKLILAAFPEIAALILADDLSGEVNAQEETVEGAKKERKFEKKF